MNKKEERDNFWISVGPESGYLGTIAEETARKNDGGISPDGERLGWKNACDDTDRRVGEQVLENPNDYNCPPFHFGDASAHNSETMRSGDGCNCGYDRDFSDGVTPRELENPDDFATHYPYGDPCDSAPRANTPICSRNGIDEHPCDCADDCDCGDDCNCDRSENRNCGDKCDCGNNHSDSSRSGNSKQGNCDCSASSAKHSTQSGAPTNTKNGTNSATQSISGVDSPARRAGHSNHGTGDDFTQNNSASGGVTVGYTPIFGADCDCGILPLPGMIPIENMNTIPPADLGPERQNTQE